MKKMINKRVLKLILKELIRPAVVLIVAVVIAGITSAQITRITESISEKRTARAILEQRVRVIDDIEDDLKSVNSTEKIEEMKSLFPPDDNIIEFILWAEGLAPEDQVPTYNFNTPRPFISDNDGISLSSINYTMNFTSNASVFLEYMSEFETAPYLTPIRSVTINAVGDGSWEDEARMSIQAELYAKTEN